MTKTLSKEFGYLSIDQTAPNIYAIDTSISDGNWQQPFAGSGFFINKQYFDLAGLSIDDKTLFFEGAAVQELYNPAVYNQAAGDSCVVIDVMSSVPLTDLQYQQIVTAGNIFATAGQDVLTFDQTIFLRVRSLAVDLDTAAWGFMVLLTDNQLGSLEPTASDRIYCARMIQMGTPCTANRIELYGARYLLRATPKEEAEYQYLMRLKRSYELQNQPDRD